MSGIDASLVLRRGDFLLEASFRTPATGVTALLGPSGCGKSTLLNCIAGLQPAEHGRLEVNGEFWQDSGRHIFVPPHRRRVGYVFQDPGLLGHLDVRGNLEYGMRRAGRRQKPGVGTGGARNGRRTCGEKDEDGQERGAGAAHADSPGRESPIMPSAGAARASLPKS